MNIGFLAIGALLPIMLGPLPKADDALTVALCGGGTLAIPLGKDREPAPPPCSMKGCHAGSCRKKLDPSQ